MTALFIYASCCLAVAANATQPGAGSSQVYAGVPHLQQQQQLQRAWPGARSDTEIDEEVRCRIRCPPEKCMHYAGVLARPKTVRQSA